MNEQDIAGQKLIELATPFLYRKDREGLVAALEGTWSAACVALLLNSENSEVARVAAECLGLIGDMSNSPAVARLLHHEDHAVVSSAEDALWSIWLRAGGLVGQRVLTKIAECIRKRETENVVAMLTELIRIQPTYAEAFHQRAQAHYLEGSYDAALRDARRAVQLNPDHFGALSIQAHVFADSNRHQEAIESYRSVLRIHPHLDGVRESISHLRERLVHAGDPAAHLSIVPAE